MGGWVERSAMVDTTKITAHAIGHVSYAQALATDEQKHFSLISFHSARKRLLFDYTCTCKSLL